MYLKQFNVVVVALAIALAPFVSVAESGVNKTKSGMATEGQKACTKECSKEKDPSAYETCLIKCNKANKKEQNNPKK